MRMRADLDEAVRIAQRDVRAGKEIDVLRDDEPAGGALDEAVGVEADVRSDSANGRPVLHVEAAVETDVVADLEPLGMLDENVVVDDDVLAAGLESLAVVHGRNIS